MKKNLIPILMILGGLIWFFYLYLDQEKVTLFALPTSGTESNSATDGVTMVIHEQPRPMPAIGFTDAQNNPVTLQDYRGKFILLNVWATWCEPCREEMPSLDRLQATIADTDFQVIALSTDPGEIKLIEDFYREYNIHHLAIYHDATQKVEKSLNVAGLPSTFLINRQGQLIANKVGYAIWDSDAFITFIRNQLKSME